MNMAEIYLLDKNLNWASPPLDDFTSLVWSPAWSSNGSFSITGSRKLLEYIRGGAEFIWMQGRKEIGLLDDIEYNGKQCTVSGGFSESMLGWRILLEETHFSGNAEQAVLRAAESNLRGLPLVEIGGAKGFSELAETVMERGMALDEVFRTVLRPLGMSYAVSYTGGTSLSLEIVKGTDRTQNQTENSWAIFSESFENIAGCTYTRRRGNTRNAATVYATYGETVISETVSRADDGMIREGAFWADIDQEEMTEGEFRAVLASRAAEYLEEYRQEESISGEAEGSSLIPGIDYDVGDMVDIVMDDIGLAQSERITGLDIVMENGAVRTVPKFGAEQMSVKALIRREMKRI